MHLSSGEASWATTERKRRPRAVAVWPAGRGLALEWQQVCQRANMGPERQLWRREAPSPLAVERTSAPRRSRASASLRARQRAAAPSQWAGGRGRLRRKEPLPPLPSRSSPPPPPPRAHLRGSHKGAGRPAHGRADKGAAATLPSTSWCPVRGCRAAERFQTAYPPVLGPTGLAAPHTGGPTPHTKPHARIPTPVLIPPHTHIYIQVFLHMDRSTSHTCVHTQTHRNTLLCAQAPTPTLPTCPPSLHV